MVVEVHSAESGGLSAGVEPDGGERAAERRRLDGGRMAVRRSLAARSVGGGGWRPEDAARWRASVVGCRWQAGCGLGPEVACGRELVVARTLAGGPRLEVLVSSRPSVGGRRLWLLVAASGCSLVWEVSRLSPAVVGGSWFTVASGCRWSGVVMRSACMPADVC